MNTVKGLSLKSGKNVFKISPSFNPDNLKDEYVIVSPILRLNAGENITPELLENKTKFLGLAGIKFSTKRIFSKVAQARKNLIKINSIIAVSMIIFGIIAAILFAALMIKPIINLVKGVQIVGKGDFEHKTPVITKDEIGALTKAFNKMTDDLKDAQEAMIKKKLLEEQFSIAEGIQISLIPTEKYFNTAVEVVGYYKSALGVGGDYYDYFKIDDERIGVIISDVAGKGIPASLIMVQIQTVFTTYLNKDSKSAARLIETINNNLAETIQPGLFATVLFVIYNEKSREIMFSNAGHGPLEYFSASENRINKLLTETPPTGIMPGMEYKDTTFKLNSGDIVYMYTDGITEAMSINREEFGNDRLEEIIIKSSRKSAYEINNEIVEAVQKFTKGAEQSDDISLIIMKIK
jgi:sigma-B regulation protein RsbU (phosphoserine phosphatase)